MYLYIHKYECTIFLLSFSHPPNSWGHESFARHGSHAILFGKSAEEIDHVAGRLETGILVAGPFALKRLLCVCVCVSVFLFVYVRIFFFLFRVLFLSVLFSCFLSRSFFHSLSLSVCLSLTFSLCKTPFSRKKDMFYTFSSPQSLRFK